MRFCLFLLLFIAAIRGVACDCTPTDTIQKAILNADLIFEGTVLKSEPNWMSGGMKYTFEVARSWKGVSDRMAFVKSGWENECGYMFKEGESYIVFTTRTHTSKKTDRCSGNMGVAEAGDLLAILGPGATPEQPKDIGKIMWIMTLATLASMIFLVFVVVRKKMFKKN